MSRLTDPICNHARRGIVTSGPYDKDKPHAAATVCNRLECIEDAKVWVNRTVLAEVARHIPDGTRS